MIDDRLTEKLGGIAAGMARLEGQFGRLERKFERVEGRLEKFVTKEAMDAGFQHMETKIQHMETKIQHMETKIKNYLLLGVGSILVTGATLAARAGLFSVPVSIQDATSPAPVEAEPATLTPT